jgi:hypothetical protein
MEARQGGDAFGSVHDSPARRGRQPSPILGVARARHPTVFKECIMFTLAFPSILSHLRQLEYGLQPVRVPPDDRFILIIKMSKEAILTARLNQQIKIYLIPDILTQGGC